MDDDRPKPHKPPSKADFSTLEHNAQVDNTWNMLCDLTGLEWKQNTRDDGTVSFRTPPLANPQEAKRALVRALGLKPEEQNLWILPTGELGISAAYIKDSHLARVLFQNIEQQFRPKGR